MTCSIIKSMIMNDSKHESGCLCLFCIRAGKAGPYPWLHRFFPELYKLSIDKIEGDNITK